MYDRVIRQYSKTTKYVKENIGMIEVDELVDALLVTKTELMNSFAERAS